MTALAQDQIVTIDIGGESKVTYPVNFGWAYTENQMILTANEINTNGLIVSLAYKRSSGGSGNPVTRNFDIYIMHTSQDAYSSISDWIPVTAADLVFSGNYTFQTTGTDWQTIVLDTPFEYNGTDNLCICIDDNTGGTSDYQYWSAHTCSVNRGIRAWGASDFDPTGSVPSSGSGVNDYIADIQIGLTSTNSPMPRNLTASNITAHEATLSWTAPNENVQSYQYQYQPAGGNWTELYSTTNTSVTLTSLLPDTDYTFQVKAIYADGESNFASKTFHTEISCLAPTDLQATLTQGNGSVATLSWTENGSATNWVLEYGTAADFTGATSVPVSGTPSHNLTGLTPETKYYARVKANCGGDDGESGWSNTEDFTPSDCVIIGQGTSASNTNPVGTYYNYSFTEQLYTAAEIGMAGIISSISFNYAVSTAKDYPLQVYMKSVDNTNLSSAIAISDDDLVYNGTLSVTGAGWVTINLTTPFEYDGVGNLLIAVNKGYVYYFSGNTWYYTSASNMARYVQNDSNAYTPTSSLPSTSASSNRPNIKIAITPSSTPKPQGLTSSNVTAHEATLSWTAPNENVVSYQYQYQPAGGEWSQLYTTTETSVTLSSLTSDTDYTFQVRALYTEGESNFASKAFHTEISCPVPTNLQASFALVDPTTATASWTENGEATNWVLEYGTAADFTGATSVNVSGTPTKVLTGLTPETKYYLRVKADCGEGDQSQWSGVYEFTPTAYIIIGDEATTNSSYHLPISTYNNYSVTQQIYTAAEVAAAGGVAGTITSIGIYYKGYTTATSMEGIQVYMKNTSKSSFTSNADFVAVGVDDKVFEGTLPLPVESGWITLELDKEFNYDGTSSILVCFFDPSDAIPGGGYQFYYTNTSYSSSLIYLNTAVCPDVYNLTSYSANSRNNYHSNIRFLPTYTPRPQNLTANNVTAYAAILSWSVPNTNVTGYQYQYKEGEGDWTDLVSTTDTEVPLTLVPEAEYTFRVKALYGDIESGFSTLSFTALATCPKPTDLQCTLDEEDLTIATLTWVQGYEEEDWILQYGTDAEFAAGTYTEVTENFTVAGTTITANLTGLTPGTQYYARVRANCAPDDQSYWSNVVEFRPLLHVTVCDGTWTNGCIPMYASNFLNCTKSECIMPADSLVDIDDCQIASLTFYPSDIEKDTWGSSTQQVFLREVDAPFFDYITNWSDTTQVFVGNLSCPSRSDETYTITFNRPYTYHGGYLLIGVYNLSDYNGSSNSIYWYGIQSNALQGASRYGWAGYINYVSFTQTNFLPKTTFNFIPNPTARPRNLAASNIAIHSATLSWTAANEDVTGYQYRYKPEGGDWTSWTSTSALSVDLEGLAAETEYTFQVIALYGEVESNIASTTFTPTQNLFLPLYVGATNATSNVPIYGSYSNNYAKNECLYPATKLAEMDGASISAITFYAKEVYSGTLNSTYQIFVKEVDYDVLTEYGGTEGATIVYEGQLPEPTLSLDGYTIPFTQEYVYHGGNLLIGLYNITPGTSTKQVNWYGVYTSDYASANGYNSSSLESVGFSRSKWLPKTTFTYFFRNPWNLQASNYTVDGATLSWNEPRVDYLRCEYQYQAEGSEEWTDLVSTNETAVALSGLTSETNYVFRVRAVYEGEVTGDFISFTFQIPVFIDVAHPFADGFEEGNHWMLFNGTETNQWMIGTATANNSTNSLYISNDGQNNSYSYNTSHVFATKLFHLDAGSYEVGYDWKNKGCSQDKVRVVLAPESATFVGGETSVEYIQSEACIALDNDGGTLYNSTSWNSLNKQFEVPEDGEYKVVFYWFNFNGTAYDPPAAIDNFYLNKYLGDAPSDLTVSNITPHTADLSWDENGTAEAWQVKYYTYAEYQASGSNVDDESYGHIVDAATNTDFTLTELEPETSYYFFVRSSYTVDDMTGYTHWSNSGEFQTAVSCFPVDGLEVTSLGTTSATLAWGIDPQQEAGNAPSVWNVVYAEAAAITYDFESESGTPEYDGDETIWSVAEDSGNAHSGSHYLQSNNSDSEASIYFPAVGGAAASFWAKSLVEGENDTVYISVYYNGNSSSGSGGEYKGRGSDKGRSTYMGEYLVTSDTYKKIALDLADYQGNGTLELRVSGMVAIDDVTVNVLSTTVTQQMLDFNQGSLGNSAQYWDGWSLVIDGENGYIISEANYEDAYVDFPIQLGSQISFRAKALDITEPVEYTVYVFDQTWNEVATKPITVTNDFDDYTWDLSEYSGTAYLEFYVDGQPSLVIDDLSLPLVSTYTALTVDEPTWQLTDLEQLAVYQVYVQAHCGEEDDSNWEYISFVPALCESENQCMITYEWSTEGSGYGNDAYLKFVHHESGLRMGMAYMAIGTSGSQTLSLCDGEDYDVYFYYSGKDSHVDFTIYDAAGEVITNYAQFQNLPEGQEYITFTMDCDVCQWPLHLTATNITDESALLTWENGGPNYNVRYRNKDDHGTQLVNEGFEDLETGLPTGWYGASYDETNEVFELSNDVWDLYYNSEGAITGVKMLEATTDALLLIPVTNAGDVTFNAYVEEIGPKKQNRDGNLTIGVYNGDINDPFTIPEENIKWSGSVSGLGNVSVDLEGYTGYLFINASEGMYIDDVMVYEPTPWTTINNVANTQYQLTPLEPGSTYEVQVQSACGVDEFSNWASSEFTTLFCNPASQCEIQYDLSDSFGDGWNGAYIAIVSGSTEVARLTIESGYSLSGELPLCPGSYRFVWHSGEYDNECSFEIIGSDEVSIISISNPSAGPLLDEPYEHVCRLEVLFTSGWNWWAPTAETNVLELEALDELESILSQGGSLSGDLDLVAGQMYKVLVNGDCLLSLNGDPFTTANVSIAPSSNWFGFIGTEMSVTEAFANFGPVAGDKVISQNDGFAIYNGTEWVGTLTALVPGKGYIYVSQDTESKTLQLGQ